MKVYKVTTRSLTSVNAKMPETKIKYKVGEWVFPTIPNSGIFVFLSASMALRYAWTTPFSIVWECEAPKASKISKMPNFYDLVKIRGFWGNGINRRNYRYTYEPAPKGSYVVAKIKLIKKVT